MAIIQEVIRLAHQVGIEFLMETIPNTWNPMVCSCYFCQIKADVALGIFHKIINPFFQ
jgi:hypothetical protein